MGWPPRAHLGVSLSAGHEQMEQDRASNVLPHHRELAWAAVGESGGSGEPDRAYEAKSGLTIRSELDGNSYPTGSR